MSRKTKKLLHKPSFESLIAWGCHCGARWMNEKLKHKTDVELAAERDLAFEAHVREMGRQGF